MNALERYFQETGTNPTTLAAKVGVAPSTLSRPIRGERNANVDLAIKVEAATEGRVTVTDFISVCAEARKAFQGEIAASKPLEAAQ